jgi:hypothetical protein
VLASGLGGTSSWWAPQLVRFAQEFTTLAFDRRAEYRRLDIPVRVLCTKDDILTPTTFPREWPG